MKPRRLTVRALENIRSLLKGEHIRLEDIAEVLDVTIDLTEEQHFTKMWRLVEGINIRAVEGVVIPQFPCRAWQIIERKQRTAYQLQENDIIVGLVRPERRNIGMLLTSGVDLVGSPDGIGVVRLKEAALKTYSQEWLFAALRSERSRLQLWTESGGTSYGKLTRDHILNVVLPVESEEVVASTAKNVRAWADEIKAGFAVWESIGTVEDRIPIINSPIFGLESED
jgi:type I restriction enzyme M protein